MSRHSRDLRQLSRSKLDLFLECQRCFFEDVAQRNPRPPIPAYSLNNTVDALFKREFDEYRARGEPHPLFARVSLDAVPLQDPRLNDWRDYRKGVRWDDPVTGWTLYGAVDDLWRGSDGRVIVADYKATATDRTLNTAGLYPQYRRQADVYQFLVAQQGYAVDERAWFVYANAVLDATGFRDTLSFRTTLVPYVGNQDWVMGAFHAAVATATSTVAPRANPDCKWCACFDKRTITVSAQRLQPQTP